MHLAKTSLFSLFSVVAVATACGSHDDSAGTASSVAADGGGITGTISSGSTPGGPASPAGALDSGVAVTGSGMMPDAGAVAAVEAGTDAAPPGPADPAVQLAHIQAAGKVFSAQYLEDYSNSPDDSITKLVAEGAPKPAGVGLMRTAYGPTNTKSDSKLYYLNEANGYLAAGNQVMVSFMSGNPLNFDDGGPYMCPGPSNQPGTGGEDMANSNGASSGSMSSTDFRNLTDPTTKIGQNWKATMELYAADLAQLEGIVLFRAFFEMNGVNGKWWNNQNATDYIALWKYTHDYLNNDKNLAAKLRWVWAINAGEGNYDTYYPGDAYVDVVGLDAYGADGTEYTGQTDGQPPYKSPMATLFAHKKPVIFAETGCSPGAIPDADTCDYTHLLAAVKSGADAANLPLPAAMYVWFQGWSMYQQNSGAEEGKATAYLHDPRVVNLDQLASYN